MCARDRVGTNGESRRARGGSSRLPGDDLQAPPAWVSTVEAPVWICDLEGRLTFVNTYARELLGLSDADWTGKLCHEVVRGTDIAGNAHCQPGCRNYRCARKGLPIEPDEMWVTGACSKATAQGVRIKTVSLAICQGRPADHRLVHIALEMPNADGPNAFIVRVSERSAPQASPTQPPPAGSGHLTRRELQVLHLLGQDMSPKVIAAELGVSYATVRTHIQHILPKLGAHSILEATVRYLLGKP